jgi:RHS repeat-associated protein
MATLFYLSNHIGSTSLVVDSDSGAVVESRTDLPYGAPDAEVRSSDPAWQEFTTDYTFTSKEKDADIDLFYFGERYLNPMLGRWISGDPLNIFHSRDSNAYRYTRNNPISLIDPFGLDEQCVGSCEFPDEFVFGSTQCMNPTSESSSEWYSTVEGEPNLEIGGGTQGQTMDDAVPEPADMVLESQSQESTIQVNPKSFFTKTGIIDPYALNKKEKIKAQLAGTGEAFLESINPVMYVQDKSEALVGADYDPTWDPEKEKKLSGKEYKYQREKEKAIFLAGMMFLGIQVAMIALGKTPKFKEVPKWPSTANEMDKFLGIIGERIPDLPNTPGRNKVVWKPNMEAKITFEEHPYHPNAPKSHIDPHWHLDLPGIKHKRFLPGEDIPGY